MATSAIDLVAPGGARPRAGTYRISPERCVVRFRLRQGLTSVNGTLRALEGQVVIDRSDMFASWVRLDLDATSVNTRSPERDAALRGPRVLDADAHPIVRFESTRLLESGPARFTAWGDLYAAGRTVDVAADVRVVSVERRRLRLAASAVVRRSDLGIGWGSVAETSGVIGDRIRIDVATEAVA